MVAKRGRPPKAEKLTLDFSEVTLRKPIDDGWHRFRVAKVEKNKGPAGDYIEVTSEVISGKCEGGISKNVQSLSPQSLWKVAQFLDALGFDVSGELTMSPSEMIDMTFLGKVVNEEYEGVEYPKIRNYKADKEDSEDELETESDEDEDDSEAEDDEGSDEEEDDSIEISEEDIKSMSAEELETLLHEVGIKAKLIGTLTMKQKRAVKLLKDAGHL